MSTMTRGCGCGTSTASPPSSGCGCGGSCGCEVSSSGSGFERPRFFGGMLLTEDDLQSMTDYMVGKRKLTNRYVFGAGVVCGLDLGRDPCDPGTIIVDPGYAIDCCGNDIVVECPETVDILDLVAQLRRDKGTDCGEPCNDLDDPVTYHLFIRYAEQSSSPVAPYATDDCATGECEFSRVREGYGFELRCDPFVDEPTMIDAIIECWRGTTRVKEDTAAVQSVYKLTSAVTVDGPTYEGPAPAIPRKREMAAIDPENWGEVRRMMTQATDVMARHDAFKSGMGPSVGLTDVRRGLLHEYSREMVAKALAADDIADRPAADAAELERLLEMQGSDMAAMSDIERRVLPMGLSLAEANRQFVTKGEQVRMRVLSDMEHRGMGGSPEHRQVQAMQMRQLDQVNAKNFGKLMRIQWKSLLACVCSSANPACPTCTDLAVPLASVTVQGCEVVDLCPLERRWVLSPKAMGYWFPIVNALRGLLARFCCDDDRCEDGADDTGQIEAQMDMITMDRKSGWLAERSGMTVDGLMHQLEDAEPVQLLAALFDQPNAASMAEGGGGGGDLDQVVRAIADGAPLRASPVGGDGVGVAVREMMRSMQAKIDELSAQVAEMAKERGGDSA